LQDSVLDHRRSWPVTPHGMTCLSLRNPLVAPGVVAVGVPFVARSSATPRLNSPREFRILWILIPTSTGRSDHQTLRRCSLQHAALPKASSGHVSWRSSMLTITRSIHVPGHSKDSLASCCCHRARVRTRRVRPPAVVYSVFKRSVNFLVGRKVQKWLDKPPSNNIRLARADWVS
jgi:hypothetical protein